MSNSDRFTEPLYDPGVLDMSRAEKLAYFKDVRIRHPRIAETVAELEILLEPNSGVDVVLLIGPTGVGKTTLIWHMYDTTLKTHAAEIAQDPSYIPAVFIVAPSIGSRNGYSWEETYMTLLDELGEPMVSRKSRVRFDADGKRATRNRLVMSGRGNLRALRQSVESSLHRRRTGYVAFDEAVHIIRQSKPKDLPNQMDTLKSLSDAVNTHFVLIGSYDLYQELIRLSGQFARRAHAVHFARYRPGVKADEAAFISALVTLQRYLPLPRIPDLSPRWAELMDASLGCFGTLKETLQRALSIALARGIDFEEALSKAKLSQAQLSTILGEILEGERLFEAMNETGTTPPAIAGLLGKKRRGHKPGITSHGGAK